MSGHAVGLAQGMVMLCPHQDAWQRLFEEEKALLQAVVGQFVLDIQHIGSTSIRGLIAKPIIDIGVAVESFEEAQVCVEPIKNLGYSYRGENGIPRRHYFVKGEPRTHHLHVVEITSAGWRENLFFRDYLRQNSQVAADYADLQTELARQFQHDRHAFQNSKDIFIKQVLDKMTGNPLEAYRDDTSDR